MFRSRKSPARARRVIRGPELDISKMHEAASVVTGWPRSTPSHSELAELGLVLVTKRAYA